ncbi:MAG: DNA glycosylase, partial [Nanoarchaeota archaeon]|nr:DNA glycosylase [Nanoarchaeota archaeon]
MLIPVKNFSIDTTLMAGQTFAWKKFDKGWISFVDKPVLVRQISENELMVTGETSRGEIERRLGLKDDIEKIISSIDKDETVHQAILHSPGLRIVEDGLWVSLLSFILSIQSNIPLINKRIEVLSSIYGRKEAIEGKEIFSFPTYSQIYEHPELLKRAKLGFREKFVLEAANFLQKEGVQIENMKKIREKLSEIKGVGDKVLDCVML